MTGALAFVLLGCTVDHRGAGGSGRRRAAACARKTQGEAFYDQPPNVQPPIGYNEFDRYYADLKTDRDSLAPGHPFPEHIPELLPAGSQRYRPAKADDPERGRNVPADTAADNKIRLKELELRYRLLRIRQGLLHIRN